MIEEQVRSSTSGILPDVMASSPKAGFHEPYNTLGSGQQHVSLLVTFDHPFAIMIFDIGNYSESELVQKLKIRLETELANVEPTVSVTFRRDRTQLD